VARDETVTFLVATYGSKHLGMLLAHLHAIRRTHPDAKIEVYHQDWPAPQGDAIRRAHPEVRFIETRFDFAGDRILRISTKTLAWEQAALAQPDGEEVCLLDVDTLVCRSLAPFFAEAPFDVLFTWKEGGFVLNTGVLLCRMNSASRAFFPRWREETLAILRDPERFRRANDPREPFGAADQMALHEMLGYRAGQTRYEITIAGERVRLRGEPCEVLNETRSCPITERTHIIHFKGGWQPILLEGRRFTRHRTRADCWEMYRFYLDTFREALGRMNAALGADWHPRDFRLHVPRYVAQPRPLARGILYAAHVAGAWLRELRDLARGFLRLLSRKLKPCRS
jgi:hypothetical protein